MSLWSDAVLRAPLWGSVLLSLALSLIGVILFIRKKVLIGEVLAHACYPGVTLAIFFSPWLPSLEPAILSMAALSALLGFWLVHLLRKELGIKEDAALGFVLATFFGMGTLLASLAQTLRPTQFRQIPMYLYGQAATLQDRHLLIAGGFALLVIALIVGFYRSLLLLSFDRAFAKTSALAIGWIDSVFILLVAGATILGMRSLGVILLSALMIAPATAARQFTNRLSLMLVLAGLFGMFSGCVGTLISLRGWPTGPCIVMVAGSLALLALTFAPKRGILFRQVRILRFHLKIKQENLLKALWHHRRTTAPRWLWWMVRWKGWVTASHTLTNEGVRKGAHIVRLHRLWEAYLVHSLGMGVHQVHACAEEMEHILTPALEKELVELLGHPRTDPHAQPIPEVAS